MPHRAFLNASNEVVAVSGHGADLATVQAEHPELGAIAQVDNAPDLLIHKQQVTPQQVQYHRLTGGNAGTELHHYVLETIPVIPPAQAEGSRMFSGYRGTNINVQSSGVTKVTMDKEHCAHDTRAYAWSPGGAVQILEASRYDIDLKVSAKVVSDRNTTRLAIQIYINGEARDGTLGFADLEPRGYTPGQHISVAAGLDLVQGDEVILGAYIMSGSSTIQIVAGASTMKIIQTGAA